MNGHNQEIEFNVLGFNVKFKPEEDLHEGQLPANQIVEYVHNEASKIKNKAPHLTEGQVAILLALQFAADKLILQEDYRTNIDQLQMTAKDALAYIEEIYPTNHSR